MSQYWDERFLENIDNKDNIKYVFEVGARYGDESIMLSKTFPNSKIYSFECNPNTIQICQQKLTEHNNITFINRGLGICKDTLPFFSYTQDNDGASSLFKRIDFNTSQKYTGDIEIDTIENIVKEHNIPYINLLCMDVQGYELNVLKGANNFLQNIEYIIMEEPNPVINTIYLPEGQHSKYIGAPSSQEIKEFMSKNNFKEISRIQENHIEDNVMYRNTNYNV